MISTPSVVAALATLAYALPQAQAQAPAQPASSNAAPLAAVAAPRQPAQLPPPGIAIPEQDRAELTASVAELKSLIGQLTNTLKSKPALAALLPDVEIFHKAVDWPLRFNEFYHVKEVATAKRRRLHPTLRLGRARGWKSRRADTSQGAGVVARAQQ